MQDTYNNMIIIKQQHIEHQALTKTRRGRKKKETYDGNFSNEQHIILLLSWDKRPPTSKPKRCLLIFDSKPKPHLLKP